MAKKKKEKQQNFTLPQETSSTETNLFMKGMIKDTFPSISSKEVWEHAINAINNSIDGDTGVIGNEPANFECAEIPYTIIGSIHIYGDHWVIFSTDDVSSEIGTFDDSKCEYTRLINDPCLNFNRQNLIIGAAKENFECKYQVYWDDDLNPSRTLILDEPPYLQIQTSGPNIDGVACAVYQNVQPLTLDCERIRLAPLIDTPCLDLQKAPEGGSLRNGTYQAFIAYTVNDQVYGDYIGISNSQSLFEHDDSSGSLILTISNLDTEFDAYQLVMYSNTQQEPQAKEIGTYSTEQRTIKIDSIDQKLKSVPLSYIPERRSAYEKSKGMFVVNDYLVRTQPTNQFDFNYQPLANMIGSNWVSVEYPADYYYDGGNKPTFLRDETYAFFIRFIYNTGERSSSYHIPGRLATNVNYLGLPISETLSVPGDPNALDPTDTVWKVTNTAWTTNPNINVIQPDGGIIRTRGAMAYWESTELYPQDVSRYGGNCGMPIRHHKFPDDNTAVDGTTNRSTAGGNGIYILGVEFTNIAWPRYNDGSLIPNIVGYEFLVGSREGNKSILGKGIIKNMMQYTPTDSVGSDDGATLFYIPNYPYNDLTPDPYIKGPSSLGTGAGPSQAWTNQGYLDWYQGCDNGPSSGGVGMALQYNTFSNNHLTFHSPDLMFNRPYLNAYELKSYGVISGGATGSFKPSEKHPGEKLLRNSTALLSLFIGIGYAIYEMRGQKNRKFEAPKTLDLAIEPGPRDLSRGWSNTNVYALVNAHPYGVGGTTGTIVETGTETPVPNTSATGAAPSTNRSLGGDAALLIHPTSQTLSQTAYNITETAANVSFLGLGGALGSVSNGLGVAAWNSQQATAFAATPGNIGAGQTLEYAGSRHSSIPLGVGFFGGIQSFLNYISTGGQEIIDLIYNLSSWKDYVYKYNSHGWYRNMTQLPPGSIHRHNVDDGAYLNGAISQLNANVRINNLNRPTTVALQISNPNGNLPLPGTFGLPGDNSKFTIGTAPGGGASPWTTPQSTRRSNISAHYCALKFNKDNQYGQLEDIRQIPIRGCVELFESQIPVDANNNPIISTLTRFNSQPLFGGDCYINRYTEKSIMPFFWDYLHENERDGFTYDYRLYANVPFPTYWMNTEKYRLDELCRAFGGLNWILGITTAFANALPNDYYYLDRDPLACSGGGLFQGVTGTGSLFTIHEGYMYLHCNGINDFFVESELNLAQRDWGEDSNKRHYDRLTYTPLTELFHVDIIKKGNYYKYDKSLSIDQQWNRTISWGDIQPRWYDPLVAETCYTTWHKRLIYSLQAKKEAKKDFWRVFLPLNYKEFKDSINTIKPINKTGAIVLFPKLSPQYFTGNDVLTTDAGTKVTLGDGGLFVDRNWKEMVNSDVSHEYGSSESSRAVLNTPMGLFYISQEQGKIFQTDANGLLNITNQGMKWWFNKYLPSQLLATFPEIEPCPQMIDNPVLAAGCQTVYDTNNDIVYFSKRDFNVSDTYTNSPCIEYIPCEGFYYNETACSNVDQIITCPDGFTYNSVTLMCERIWTDIPFGPPPPECKLDIMLAIDCSGSIVGNSNITAMQNLVKGITNVFRNSMDLGNTQLGIMGWGTEAFALGEFVCPSVINPLFCPIPLTFTHNLIAQVDGFNNIIGGWINDYTCASWPPPWGFCNVTSGTGYGDAIWSGTNFLFGPNSRNLIPKKLVLLNDGWDATTTGIGGSNYVVGDPDRSLTRPVYTNAGTTATFVANPVTPPMVSTAPDTGVVGNISLPQPDNLIQWVQSNIHNNPQYQDPLNSNYRGQYEIIPGWLKNNNIPLPIELDYAQSVAGLDYFTSDPNPYMASDFQDANVPGIINDLVEKICPGILPQCPADCTYNAVTEECDCMQSVDPIYEDVLTYIPYQLENPTYFQDVSWTVSYDPKAKAWISFHDWHPELSFNSINHFMTSKTTTTETPQCPPGYSFVNGECCITVSGSDLANVFVDYLPAEVTLVDANKSAFSVPMDIVIVMDKSGSTGTGGACNCMAEQKAFANTLVDLMGPGMLVDSTTGSPGTINTNVRIGIGSWANGNNIVEQALTGNGPNVQTGINAITSGGGTTYQDAVDLANSMMGPVDATKRQVVIFMTDADSGCQPTTNFQANTEVIAVFTVPSGQTLSGCGGAWVTNINCMPPRGNAGSQPASQCNLTHYEVNAASYSSVAQSIIDSLVGCDCNGLGVPDIPLNWMPNIPCTPVFTDPLPQCASCECPDGYTEVPAAQPCNSMNPPICKKVTCECPPIPVLDLSAIIETFTGQCDDIILADTPGYINPDPLICHWEAEFCVPANYTVGGIWKHNVRNDLFANYYGQDYPWEITLIENSGQVVNTLRSIEYQMEAYVFKNFNLPRPQEMIGVDRWHDLDWNFDEAIIYNSEQVSGLLTLDLIPKNNVVLLNQYPIINNPTNIQILYSKEEQKYRFNQFWDITDDRGEFTGIERSIWITTLNGYIKDLNQANLNYIKAEMQHKKFRHYYNMLLLRKNYSGDRKMLLKLNNSKMNVSFR